MSLGLVMALSVSRLGQGQAREAGTESSGVSGISLSRADGSIAHLRSDRCVGSFAASAGREAIVGDAGLVDLARRFVALSDELETVRDQIKRVVLNGAGGAEDEAQRPAPAPFVQAGGASTSSAGDNDAHAQAGGQARSRSGPPQ